MSRSTECPDVSADQGRQTHREGHGGHQLWLAADKKVWVKNDRNSKKIQKIIDPM